MRFSVVIDPSAVLPHLLGGPHQSYGTSVLRSLRRGSGLSTSLFWYEIQHALLRSQRHADLDAKLSLRFTRVLEHFVDVEDRTGPSPETMYLAERHELTFYDASYLELALRARLPLATLDNKLRQAVEAAPVELFQPPERADEGNDNA